MGYKGISLLDAGYFYCPFLSLIGEEGDVEDLGNFTGEEPIYGAVLSYEEQAYEQMINWLEEGF
jgi:hypothetical protein